MFLCEDRPYPFDIYFARFVLVFVAAENDSDSLCHPWSNRPFFVVFNCKGLAFRRNDSKSLRNGGTVNYFEGGSVRLVELVSCELDLRRIDGKKVVACSFLKLIWLYTHLHLAVSVVASLFSFLRRSEAGRKVALRSLPGLLVCSAIFL